MIELDPLDRACKRLAGRIARFRWVGVRGPRGGTIARNTASGTVLRGKAAQEALSRQPREVGAPEQARPRAAASEQTPAMNAFIGHLNSSRISREQKIEYGKTVKQVLNNMPPKAQEVFGKLKWSSQFHSTSADMAQSLAKQYPDKRDAILSSKAVARYAYEPRTGAHILHLDGKSGSHSIVEVYAHEIGHIVDHVQPNGSRAYSSSPAWAEAWKAENVGSYARTDAKEGFAEFARLAWSGQYNLEAMARSFPKSFAFFKENGLIPAGSSGTQSTPQEVFDKHITLDKHNHLDAKKASPPADEAQRHEQAGAKADGWFKKIAKMPAKAVKYAVGKVKALYAKMEQKYGSRWAKTIVATAIITFPTPVMTPSVLAMTGLAHLFTKMKSTAAATFAEGQAMAWDQIDKLAAALQKHLIGAFQGA